VRRLVGLVSLLIVLGVRFAVAAPPLAGPAAREPVTAAPGKVAALVDIVSAWSGPKPPPRPRFAWADTGAFDMQMHESMTARLDRISVDVDGAYRTRAIPARMSQWLDQVRRKGGSVSICAINEGTRGIPGSINLGITIFQNVDQWLLFQPAGGYSAAVLVTAEDRLVRTVVLMRSELGHGCPPGTDAAGT
jgi:hypothetical protein